MKYILFALLILTVTAQAQTTFVDEATKDTITISTQTITTSAVTRKPYKPPVTQPPTSSLNVAFATTSLTTQYLRPLAGAEYWGGHIWDDVDAVKVPAGNTQGMDYYYRFNWRNFQTTTAGSYNWTEFDRQINYAIDRGMKFNFGVMTLDGSVYQAPSVSGAYLTYPDFLHSQMQSESYKDWIGAGLWIPNWNSNYYLTALDNLNKAIANHLNTTYYKNKLYRHVVGYIDLRGYGNFGEWHNWPYSGSTPAGRTATVTTLKRIVDSHVNAFPDHPLVAMSDGFASWGSAATPAEAIMYLLTVSNKWGPLGWRRDNWGNKEYDDRLVNNPVSGASALIMDRWKTSPIVGETWTGNADVGSSIGQCPYYDLERQLRQYHASSFGNGNYQRPLQECMRNNIRNASFAAGYKIRITSGSIKGNVLTVNWQNTGIAPTYENWDVVFEIRSGTTVVAKVQSSKVLKRFLPGVSEATFDTFPSLSPGNYSLVVKVVDPTGVRQPMPLDMTGRNTDGSYNLISFTL